MIDQNQPITTPNPDGQPYPRIDKKSSGIPPQIRVETQHIPDELINLPRWVCWKWEWRRNNWTKPLFNAKSGAYAKANDSSTWVTYSEAIAAYGSNKEFAGIGFVFSAHDDIMGVDVDGCLHSDGSLTETGQNAVRHFGDSYCEVSPSGTGLKFIIRAALPKEDPRRKNPKLDVEAYQAGRYFTVTGRRWPGSPSKIVEKQGDLNQWFASVFPDRESPGKKDRTPATSVSATVQEIVEKASAAKNGDKFRQLWSGDCSGYGDDESSADLALCSILAFWCGPDDRLIDDCFRASGLMRDKWERDDYRAGTIQIAIDGCREYYKWGRKLPKSIVALPCDTAPENGAESPLPESESPVVQLRNFAIRTEGNREIALPLGLEDLVAQTCHIKDDWPRVASGCLFVPDQASGVRWIVKPAQMTAFLAEGMTTMCSQGSRSLLRLSWSFWSGRGLLRRQ